MLEIVDARNDAEHMSMVQDLISGSLDEDLSGFRPTYDGVLLALDDGRPAGFVCFDMDDVCKIRALYTADGSPEDTSERLLSATISMAQYNGASGVHIESSDSGDRHDSVCRRMGFYETDTCPCCQRSGSICLNMNF
jgi:hypothetical protein